LNIERTWAHLAFSTDDRLRLYAKLAKLLEAGIPLLKALEELEERASPPGKKKSSEPLAVLLREWAQGVRDGRSLGEVMNGWCPTFECMIITAGDESGTLPEALRSVMRFANSGKKIRGAVVGGAIYPIVIIIAVVGYLMFFALYIIPKFAEIAQPERWQGVAKSLYLLSIFATSWWWAVLLGVAAVIASIVVSMPLWRGKVRIFADRYPPWSIYRLVVGSGFLSALATLVGAGMPVEKALQNLNTTAGPWLRERVSAAIFGIRSGLNLGESLRAAGHGFPSPEIVDDLSVYAKFGGFSNALDRVAAEWLEEGIVLVQTRMRVLNMASIVLLAVVVGWIVLGFIQIQQDLATMVQRR
jgi:type II secretory pathway component PulF